MGKRNDLTKVEAKNRGRRFRECIEYAKMNYQDVADCTGYSKNHIGKLCRGESPLSDELAMKFTKDINTAKNWEGGDAIDYEYITGEYDWITPFMELEDTIQSVEVEYSNLEKAFAYMLNALHIDLIGHYQQIDEDSSANLQSVEIYSDRTGKYKYVDWTGDCTSFNFTKTPYLKLRFDSTYSDMKLGMDLMLSHLECISIMDELSLFLKQRLDHIKLIHENIDTFDPKIIDLRR